MCILVFDGLVNVAFSCQILKTLGVYDEAVRAEFATFWGGRGEMGA